MFSRICENNNIKDKDEAARVESPIVRPLNSVLCTVYSAYSVIYLNINI